MDDLGIRLRKMSGWMNRVVGLLLLIGAAIAATVLLSSLPGDEYDGIVIAMAVLLGVVMVPLSIFFLLYPRHAWGPTPWVADHAMLCEAHPYRLRLRKHPSAAAVATILLSGGGTGADGEDVRLDGEQAVRIVAACERWAAQLEADPAAYREFWRRWGREDPEVIPTELLFGSQARGGFITCVDRRHRWFLLTPHRRTAHPANPWHHAHALPVWWTFEHAKSMGIDWGSMNGSS